MLYEKMVQLLHEVAPSASRFGLLTPRGWWEGRNGASARAGAEQIGVTMVPLFVDRPVTEATIRSAIDSMAGQDIHAIYVSGSTDMYAYRDYVAEQIAAVRLPAIGYQLEHARAGLLMCYAPDFIDWYRRLATYVDRILKGADPGELPIEQPTEIKLVINLKTARALGITIPRKLLIQATELIE